MKSERLIPTPPDNALEAVAWWLAHKDHVEAGLLSCPECHKPIQEAKP
jgi:hypothetical protein